MSSTATLPRPGRDEPLDLEVQDQHRPGPPDLYASWKRLRSQLTLQDGEVYEAHSDKNPRWYQKLLDAGVEENGIKPVPVEQRTSTQYNNLFTVFFTCLLGLLPYAASSSLPGDVTLTPSPSPTGSRPACWPPSTWA
jgi:hypothetical protein